jgi:hypothetical protein
MTRRHWLAALASSALLLAAAGCAAPASGESPSSIAAVEAELASAEHGRVDLQFLGAAAEGPPVGFRVAGTYSLRSSGPYPVLDLAYVRTPGEATAIRVVSTGDAVYAGSEGSMGELPPDQARRLRLHESGGIGDFSFASWIVDAREGSDRESGARVTSGTVDVAAFLDDLARLAAHVSGDGDPAALDGDAVEQLRRTVTSSSIRVVSDARTDQLRSLHVRVDMAPQATEQLREALGPYGALSMELLLRYEPLDAPLEVAVP